jgi:hypothetical protein
MRLSRAPVFPVMSITIRRLTNTLAYWDPVPGQFAESLTDHMALKLSATSDTLACSYSRKGIKGGNISEAWAVVLQRLAHPFKQSSGCRPFPARGGHLENIFLLVA